MSSSGLLECIFEEAADIFVPKPQVFFNKDTETNKKVTFSKRNSFAQTFLLDTWKAVWTKLQKVFRQNSEKFLLKFWKTKKNF